LAITAGKHIKTVSLCFPANAAPVPAVLCFCKSGVPDPMGWLCRFCSWQYHSVCARCGMGYGTERPDRRQTAPVSLGSGSRCVAAALLSGLSVPLCSQTLLAVSLLWVPVPISCTDARRHSTRERMPVEHKRTAYQICKTEVLSADYPIRLPGV